MEAARTPIADAEDSQDNQVDSRADHRHAAAEQLCRLDIVYSLGNQHEARRVDQHVDHSPEVVARDPDFHRHLQQIVCAQYQ